MPARIRSISSELAPFMTADVIIAVAIAAVLGIITFRLQGYFSHVQKFVDAGGIRSKRQRIFCICAAMLLPLVIRCAMLPWVPPPAPYVHDEFGHLLVADTLLSGRLANPPHQLWRHLETIYVLQQPAYASIYPIGQGLILAVGRVITGFAWGGVLLAVALMCGAVTWMLFGCVPGLWPLVGGVLTCFTYGLSPRSVDSYYGGAFCGFGGALVFGGLCRLDKRPSAGMSFLVAFGWAIVWLTRPFESLLVLIALSGVLVLFAARDRERWSQWLKCLAVAVAVGVLTAGVTALHNRAVTGNFTVLPYRLSQKAYGVPQSLLWQKPIPEPPLKYEELREMYQWQRSTKEHVATHKLRRLAGVARTIFTGYVKVWYALPLLLAFLAFRERYVAFAIGLLAAVWLTAVLYPFFQPHYFAAYSCVTMFLIVRGLMLLCPWRFRGIAAGSPITVFFITGAIVSGVWAAPKFERAQTGRLRAETVKYLLRQGGKHVVFVRYSPDHNMHEEWVYNAAEIDAAPIVWCRATEPADETDVQRYFANRRFWLATVDKNGVALSHYEPGLPTTTVLRLGTPPADGPSGIAPTSPAAIVGSHDPSTRM